jgi:hypothetical protein
MGAIGVTGKEMKALCLDARVRDLRLESGSGAFD